MVNKQEKDAQKKGRLTLTGNKMPDGVYRKLEEKGLERKLTPYIVGLVEKEEMMDKLIENLSALIHKVDGLDDRFSGLESKLEGVNVSNNVEVNINEEEIKQGDLEIKENIIGCIEEDIEEIDF
ncbi:hypothetical protein MPH61_23390 [Peribacillus muralis]|uniref:hypothetical protein n=1 Tax=Peribacillus muralis TaxID=264697 RepID=UPI001F4DC82D|nr:hypothetical protein [Peribacillus muralis]MCK1995470.1 hypothetical protein [Peribacillus muralis]MCK2016053.1 hypothetical protein [Peribacillus muralis]